MPFDTEVGIAGKVRREDGEHDVHVRWPKDEEWVERSKGMKIIQHRLGRGVSETKVESEQADLRLYLKIREGDAPELTADEAKSVIDTVSRCDIMNVELSPDQAEVDLLVPGARVKHVLRIPTTAEVTQFRRAAARAIDLPHNVQQFRLNLHAGSELWDKCHISHEGYANGVPITHRDAAMRAVIEACERAAQAPEDEDF